MPRQRLVPGLLVVFSILVIVSAFAAAPAAKKKAAPSDAQLIAGAMSAAPAAVAKNATIITMTADKKMRTLRKGTNSYTCMPDNPDTPGPDPMCADKNAMEWIDAWMGKKTPAAGKVGFMYMLAGGTDASN